jgi:hypothetical protein
VGEGGIGGLFDRHHAIDMNAGAPPYRNVVALACDRGPYAMVGGILVRHTRGEARKGELADDRRFASLLRGLLAALRIRSCGDSIEPRGVHRQRQAIPSLLGLVACAPKPRSHTLEERHGFGTAKIRLNAKLAVVMMIKMIKATSANVITIPPMS